MRRTIRPSALHDLLNADARERSGDANSDWSAIIGPLHTFPGNTRATRSWLVIPGGTPSQRAVIKQSVASIMAAHPHVSAS
jgi:hypothetical protein